MVIGGFSFNNVECEKNGLGGFVDGGFWLWDVWIFYVYYFYFIVYDLWFEVYIYKMYGKLCIIESLLMSRFNV